METSESCYLSVYSSGRECPKKCSSRPVVIEEGGNRKTGCTGYDGSNIIINGPNPIHKSYPDHN